MKIKPNKAPLIKPKKELEFDAKTHSYSYNGIPLQSVTQFVSSFFEPFDTEYWANYTAKKKGVDPVEVKKEWETKRRYGTHVHELIEEYIQKGKLSQDGTVETDEAIAYLRALGGTQFAEMRVFDPTMGLAGTIDAVIDTPHGTVLVDWKVVKNITKEGKTMGKKPLSHLPDCNFVKYSLQLNCYKHLLEKTTGRAVTQMCIVQLNKKLPIVIHPVLSYPSEIKAMLSSQL